MNFDGERVLAALEFAITAHDGQRRKWENEPYVMHPIRVARRVARTFNATTEMVIAALLHDVIEDCPVSEGNINLLFGKEVKDMVVALTDPPAVKGGPNRAERKKITLKRLYHSSPAVQTIKLADILDNTPSIVLNDHNFAPIFLREVKNLAFNLNRAEPVLADELIGMLEWAEKEIENRAKSL